MGILPPCRRETLSNEQKLPVSGKNDTLHLALRLLRFHMSLHLWCTSPRGHPPALVIGQNLTLYTQVWCWPECCGPLGPDGHNSCQRGTSCPQRCHEAFPPAGRRKTPHRGPDGKKHNLTQIERNRRLTLKAVHRQCSKHNSTIKLFKLKSEMWSDSP